MKRLQISDLSLKELERVQETLVRRFGIGKRGNVIQIGFGIAEIEKRNELDWDRTNAVCFYVSRKTKTEPRARSDRIPAEIRVRIRRGRFYDELVAPTDVIVVKRSLCSLSGRPIEYANLEMATTGALLVWKPRGRARLTWGVLSVGHTFPADRSLPERVINVQIKGTPPIPGRFVAVGSSSNLDASLTIVRKNDLIRSGVIPGGFRPSGKRVRTVDQIRQDIGEFGTTLPRASELPFQVQRFLVTAPIFRSKLGFAPKHVLHVGRAANGCFRPGTSGSPWRITRQPACVQFGTYQPRYNEGFGHALSTIIEWAQVSVSNLLGVAADDVEIRLVELF